MKFLVCSALFLLTIAAFGETESVFVEVAPYQLPKSVLIELAPSTHTLAYWLGSFTFYNDKAVVLFSPSLRYQLETTTAPWSSVFWVRLGLVPFCVFGGWNGGTRWASPPWTVTFLAGVGGSISTGRNYDPGASRGFRPTGAEHPGVDLWSYPRRR